MGRRIIPAIGLLGLMLVADAASAEVKTWDGRHSIRHVVLRVVYFVPNDRVPLRDWRDRAQYFCDRIEQFHQREYGGQSTLIAELEPTPFASQLSTEQLRQGDADAIFFKTLREVDERLRFATEGPEAFPILLVLSDINWRPLDDFYRLKPGENKFEFEGNFSNQQHFPGASSGGARATYLAEQRKGWGLVSADGWRVPYRGSDCVAYHEGVGHTVGLPHPEPGNGSVMSLGQYMGWLSESWLDKEQKLRMGWNPELHAGVELNSQQKFYSSFRAIPRPLVPKPGEPVEIAFDWPENARLKKCRIEFQTALRGPWIDSSANIQLEGDSPPETILLGTFNQPTPVSYRVRATLADGSSAELWGYFQVTNLIGRVLQPGTPSPDLWELTASEKPSEFVPSNEMDILANLNLEDAWKQGDWTKDGQGRLISPQGYGMRIELPADVPSKYRMVVIAEPLDEPNALLIGSRLGTRRFATTLNYTPEDIGVSALENVDGRNVGNETTLERNLFQKGRLSQIVVTVNDERVEVLVDGSSVLDWSGKADRLSLGDYWSTPDEAALFLGSYDCSYRFHRVTISKLIQQIP